MFQRKIDKIFKDLPNVFAIVDDILVVGYEVDGKERDDTLWKVLKMWRQVNLKLNKDKCHFRLHQSHFWWNHIQAWCDARPTKAKSPDRDATSEDKKGTQCTQCTPWNNLLLKPHFLLPLQAYVNHLESWLWAKWNGHGMQHTRKLSGKIKNKRECMYEILWWNSTTVPRNRHIWSQTWRCLTTN